MSTPTARPKTNLTPYLWNAQTLQTATNSLNSRWYRPEPLISTVISTDTRTIGQGDIFLALSGDNFDGHDYAQMAVDKGAVAIIVERALDIDIPQLIVSNARLALGQLGAYRRQQHPNLKVIAVTGSSGKTTVKEMLGSIFANLPNKPPTLVTRGNLNNDLGVPLMLLELCDEHEFAILELGANHLGEIAYTTNIVQPDVACILNIGTAHLGEFGGRDKIAEAKAEIYQGLHDDLQKGLHDELGLNAEKIAVIPETDEYAEQLRTHASKHTSKLVGFGKTDVTASDVQIDAFASQFLIQLAGGNAHKVELPLAGEHNVSNALAVTACALSLGIEMADIIKGLEKVQPPKGRLYSQMVGKHRLVDDAYNANPHSVRASANVVASQDGLKVMVLGDIGELGDSAKSEHYQLGADIAKGGEDKGGEDKGKIDRLYVVGEFAEDVLAGAQSVAETSLQATAYSDKADLLTDLQAFIDKHKDEPATILFKGSRFMQMETLFDSLI